MSTSPNTDSLRIERIRVRRYNGLEHDGLEAEDLSSGINVVYGPNGRGKTTLARSVQRLLWHQGTDNDRPTIDGRIQLRGEQWNLELDAGHPNVQCDGQARDWQPPASPEHRDRYFLALHDLIRADDADFAQTILRDAIGGIDLQGAADELGFKGVAPRKSKQTREAETARKNVRDIRTGQEELKTEQARLSSLRLKLKDAERATGRVAVLQQALEVREAARALHEANIALEAFSEVLARMSGNEAAQLDNLDQELKDAAEALRSAENKYHRATASLQDSPLSPDGLPDTLLVTLQERLRTLKDHEQDRERYAQEIARHEAQAANTWKPIEGAIDQDKAAQINLTGVRDLGETLKKTQKWRLHVESVQADISRLKHADSDAPASATILQNGITHLRAWLRTPMTVADEPEAPGRMVLLGSAIVLAILAVALGMFVAPWLVGLVLIALVLGWVWYQQGQKGGASSRASDRDMLRGLYERTRLESPADWTESHVEALLDRLEIQLEQAKSLKKDQERLSELQHQLQELEKEREVHQQAHRTLADRLGIELKLTEQELFVLLTKLERWLETREQLAGAEAAHAKAVEQHIACLSEMQAALEPYGFQAASDHADVAGQVDRLGELDRAYGEAVQQLNQAEHEHTSARERHDRCRAQRDDLFTSVGLEPEDEAMVRDLCAQHASYKEAFENHRKAETKFQIEGERLKQSPGYESSLFNRSAEDLQEDIQVQHELAQQAEELRQEIASIEAEINLAEKERDLEKAQSDYQKSLDALADAYEADVRNTLGHLLVQHIKDQTRDQELPQVFHKARELFRQITRGRYRLDMDSNGQGFRAYDTMKERGFALRELSSGTRVQLLLAVRIAFVERQEQGVQLPLLMDETLANSDDVKAQAIIDAVLTLCRSGRQVFYFTAREDEVTKWIQRTEHADGIACNVVSLDEQTTSAELRERVLPAPFIDTSIPAPEGRSHDAYRSVLTVPVWDAYEPLGSLHLWYAFDDAEALYALLRNGVAYWGPLNALYPDSTAISGVPVQVGDRAFAYVKALEAWQKGWRIGRGKPVDRQVLEESGAISDTFIDRVTEVCHELNGEAERLVHFLASGVVERFQKRKVDELEDYLRSHGYITDQEPLSPDMLKARYLQAIKPELDKSVLSLEQLDTFFHRLAL